jgi:P27 family predicted phage terminase small subunit
MSDMGGVGSGQGQRRGSRGLSRLRLAGGGLERFDPPGLDAMSAPARDHWEALWSGDTLAACTPTDADLLARYIASVDRFWITTRAADRSPLVPGSAGQDTINPLYRVAEQALRTIESCERQIGIGPTNRARLAVGVVAVARDLSALNAKFEAETPDLHVADVVAIDPRTAGDDA